MGTNIYDVYEENSSKINNGVPATIQGMSFTIAYAGSTGYADELASCVCSCENNCKTCSHPKCCETTAASKKILLGWSDIDNDSGPLSYSNANAKTLFEDLPLFYRDVLNFAGDLANFIST